MNQVWILHNSLAGHPGNTAKVERAAEALTRRGLAVRLERSLSIDGLRQAAREAIASRADAVLVAGGDGSLGTIAAELAGSSVALGFLPAGTANVWARELNLPTLSWLRPHALEQAALRLMEGRVRPVDMGRCNGRLFLLWAGIGLDAFVMQRLEARRQLLSRRLGLLYNVTAAFFESRAWPGAQMRVVVGEREVTGHYLMAVAANASWYGGLFQLTQAAHLDDGQMEVWLFAGQTHGEVLAHTARLAAGRHQAHPQLTCLTGERVEIYTPLPQVIHNDGEPLAATDHLSIQVVPRVLRILVPPEAPSNLFTNE
jgi:diacylglycerol kinase (ATP)